MPVISLSGIALRDCEWAHCDGRDGMEKDAIGQGEPRHVVKTEGRKEGGVQRSGGNYFR